MWGARGKSNEGNNVTKLTSSKGKEIIQPEVDFHGKTRSRARGKGMSSV